MKWMRPNIILSIFFISKFFRLIIRFYLPQLVYLTDVFLNILHFLLSSEILGIFDRPREPRTQRILNQFFCTHTERVLYIYNFGKMRQFHKLFVGGVKRPNFPLDYRERGGGRGRGGGGEGGGGDFHKTWIIRTKLDRTISKGRNPRTLPSTTAVKILRR